VPERQPTVRLLPTRQTGTGPLRRACRRPFCGNEIDPPSGRSRPREFCGDACRDLYQRERAQARTTLLEAQRLARQYEIDDDHRPQPVPPRSRTDPCQTAPASYLALALIAQALESIHVDIQDGLVLDLEEAMARITRAKQEGDRLLRATEQRNPALSRAIRAVCLPKISSAQVGQLVGFGGAACAGCSPEVRSLRHDGRLCCFDLSI